MAVVVYTRQACPLCEEGIATAAAVFGSGNIELVDVDLDLALLEKYTDRVPVIETTGGEVIAEGVITERMLTDYLRRRT
jgi:hypothetical protein